jgi:hypothetical protein
VPLLLPLASHHHETIFVQNRAADARSSATSCLPIHAAAAAGCCERVCALRSNGLGQCCALLLLRDALRCAQ